MPTNSSAGACCTRGAGSAVGQRNYSRPLSKIEYEPNKRTNDVGAWRQSSRSLLLLLVPGACVKEIAQSHGVHPSLIYDWRKKHGRKSRTQKARSVGLL